MNNEVILQAGPAPGRPKRTRIPQGERRRTSVPRLLGECPPKRHPACKPDGRPTYPAAEGQS